MQMDQDQFEQCLKAQLEANAFTKELTAKANLFIEDRLGEGHRFNQFVTPEIVGHFGPNDKAKQCVAYIVQQIIESGTVSPTYLFSTAVVDTWEEMKKFIKTGAEFDFGEKSDEAFHQLRLVK